MGSWRLVLRREVRGSVRVAVIGVGHVDRGDDAAGSLVARKLLAGPAPRPGKALVIAAEEAPENFTGIVRAFAPDLAVIVDSARAGRAPGSVFFIEPVDIAEEDISTHRVPLSRLARFLRETMACRVLILGIEPLSSEPGARVTPAVGRAVRTVAAAFERAFEADG